MCKNKTSYNYKYEELFEKTSFINKFKFFKEDLNSVKIKLS